VNRVSCLCIIFSFSFFHYIQFQIKIQIDKTYIFIRSLRFNINIQLEFSVGRWKMSKIGCCLLAQCVILILSVLISVAQSAEVDYCTTKVCIKTANQYLSSMNESVDPCENFYDYVCGSWVDEYP
jgi:hypothetical protein